MAVRDVILKCLTISMFLTVSFPLFAMVLPEPFNSKNAFEVLGLKPDADIDEASVKRTANRLLKKWHPDQAKNNSQYSVDQLTEISKVILGAKDKLIKFLQASQKASQGGFTSGVRGAQKTSHHGHYSNPRTMTPEGYYESLTGTLFASLPDDCQFLWIAMDISSTSMSMGERSYLILNRETFPAMDMIWFKSKPGSSAKIITRSERVSYAREYHRGHAGRRDDVFLLDDGSYFLPKDRFRLRWSMNVEALGNGVYAAEPVSNNFLVYYSSGMGKGVAEVEAPNLSDIVDLASQHPDANSRGWRRQTLFTGRDLTIDFGDEKPIALPDLSGSQSVKKSEYSGLKVASDLPIPMELIIKPSLKLSGPEIDACQRGWAMAWKYLSPETKQMIAKRGAIDQKIFVMTSQDVTELGITDPLAKMQDALTVHLIDDVSGERSIITFVKYDQINSSDDTLTIMAKMGIALANEMTVAAEFLRAGNQPNLDRSSVERKAAQAGLDFIDTVMAQPAGEITGKGPAWDPIFKSVIADLRPRELKLLKSWMPREPDGDNCEKKFE